MNRIQKMAWMTVICCGLAFALSFITVTILYFKIGFPRAMGGFGFMGLAGLAGLAPLIFRKKEGAVESDERDRMIQLRSTRAGFAASYGIFGALAMTIWMIQGPDEVINVNTLPRIWMMAFITAFFTQALTTLILYGKENQAAEGSTA